MAGCATASHAERETLLAQPIDCDVAEEDIAALEAAMPSRRERAKAGVQSVTLIGAASGVLTGVVSRIFRTLDHATAVPWG